MTVQRLFHARAPIPEDECRAGELAAKAQNDRVLAWLTARKPRMFTPWDISDALKMPITSARRACTDLQKAGDLVRGNVRVASGPFGAKSYQWGVA